MPVRILELFSGTGSVSNYCAKFPGRYEVTSLDIQAVGDFTPTHVADILTFPFKDHWQPGQFDYIHASPPCTQYSLARVKAKTPRNFQLADAMVAKAVEIMLYLDADMWTIENPNGLLKKRDVVAHLPCHTVDYCAYGTLWKKPTNIWCNLATWVPKRCSADCPALLPGTRCHRLQMSGTKNKMGADQVQCKSDAYLKGKIPEPLLDELIACGAREFNWVLE